jgi:hypothetical protein
MSSSAGLGLYESGAMGEMAAKKSAEGTSREAALFCAFRDLFAAISLHRRNWGALTIAP